MTRRVCVWTWRSGGGWEEDKRWGRGRGGENTQGKFNLGSLPHQLMLSGAPPPSSLPTYSDRSPISYWLSETVLPIHLSFHSGIGKSRSSLHFVSPFIFTIGLLTLLILMNLGCNFDIPQSSISNRSLYLVFEEV